MGALVAVNVSMSANGSMSMNTTAMASVGQELELPAVAMTASMHDSMAAKTRGPAFQRVVETAGVASTGAPATGAPRPQLALGEECFIHDTKSSHRLCPRGSTC